jgi:hypothetical protein
MEERTVKSNQIGDLGAANQEMAKATRQIAFAISKGRAIENSIAMAKMYFKMGNIAKATELMEAAELERKRVPNPLFSKTSSVPKIITPEATQSKSTGLEEAEEEEEISSGNTSTLLGVNTTVGICDAADSQCGHPTLQCKRHRCNSCGKFMHHLEPCSKRVNEDNDVLTV